MLLLVTGVEVGIIGLVSLDHFPNDFQQALAEATQGAGMAFAFRAFLPVVNLRPRTSLRTALSPEMNGVAEDFVTLVADVDPVDLTGLETDRGRAGDALQSFRVSEALGIAADFSQQSRGQGLGRPGQRAKQVMIGMLLEEGLDLFAVLIQLELEGLE